METGLSLVEVTRKPCFFALCFKNGFGMCWKSCGHTRKPNAQQVGFKTLAPCADVIDCANH